MSKLQLVIGPNEILTKKTEPVQFFNKALKEEIDEMLQVMKEAKGVGLAANQVGLNKSMFVIDVPYSGIKEGKFTKDYMRRTFINPSIKLSGEDISISEGCLSFPGKLIRAPRKRIVNVVYQNTFGKVFEEDFSGVIAIVIQHEYDHLQGITFDDYERKNFKTFNY